MHTQQWRRSKGKKVQRPDAATAAAFFALLSLFKKLIYNNGVGSWNRAAFLGNGCEVCDARFVICAPCVMRRWLVLVGAEDARDAIMDEGAAIMQPGKYWKCSSMNSPWRTQKVIIITWMLAQLFVEINLPLQVELLAGYGANSIHWLLEKNYAHKNCVRAYTITQRFLTSEKCSSSKPKAFRYQFNIKQI